MTRCRTARRREASVYRRRVDAVTRWNGVSATCCLARVRSMRRRVWIVPASAAEEVGGGELEEEVEGRVEEEGREEDEAREARWRSATTVARTAHSSTAPVC